MTAGIPGVSEFDLAQMTQIALYHIDQGGGGSIHAFPSGRNEAIRKLWEADDGLGNEIFPESWFGVGPIAIWRIRHGEFWPVPTGETDQTPQPIGFRVLLETSKGMLPRDYLKALAYLDRNGESGREIAVGVVCGLLRVWTSRWAEQLRGKGSVNQKTPRFLDFLPNTVRTSSAWINSNLVRKKRGLRHDASIRKALSAATKNSPPAQDGQIRVLISPNSRALNLLYCRKRGARWEFCITDQMADILRPRSPRGQKKKS